MPLVEPYLHASCLYKVSEDYLSYSRLYAMHLTRTHFGNNAARSTAQKLLEIVKHQHESGTQFLYAGNLWKPETSMLQLLVYEQDLLQKVEPDVIKQQLIRKMAKNRQLALQNHKDVHNYKLKLLERDYKYHHSVELVHSLISKKR